MSVLSAVRTDGDTDTRSPEVARRYPRPSSRGFSLLLAADLLAASAATVVVFGWLVGDSPGAPVRIAGARLVDPTVRVMAAALPLAWTLSLLAHGGYDRNPLEAGARTVQRIATAAITLGAVVPAVCLVIGRAALSGAAVIGIPLAAALTLAVRRLVAIVMRAVRSDAGRRRTLVAGHPQPVAGLITALWRDHASEIRVVGACLGEAVGHRGPVAQAVPVTGGLDDVASAAVRLGCEMVIVAPSPELDDVQLRRLAWELHDAGIDLVVAPALSEVALSRVTLGDVGGRLLLHVRAPLRGGPSWLVKAVFDRVAALVLLVLLAPLMLAIAVAIRLTSPGPAVFRQRRVGRYGKEFVCLKFRTMTVDADARRHEVAHLNERREGVLFKIRHDPRVTVIGSRLRRSSLDELPQLFNVLSGDMSLVGPRPPLPSEVAAYEEDVRRRLLVKPGLTGLWQVSGRSELPWSEAVRLDLAYVDNWSLALDTRILLRTATAVVRGTGAY